MNTTHQLHHPADKKPVLIIDNYDSFTYNLVHLVNETGYETEVWRNDKFDLKDIDAYQQIILSPGPGIPSEAGFLLDVIKQYGHKKRILGVCLGLQAITEVYGGELYNLSRPMHGLAVNTLITDEQEVLFRGLPAQFKTGRYHSWAAKTEKLPSVLAVTAKDDEGVIMAISHREFDVKGVQFHPESILTEFGKEMMNNWLNGN